MTTPAPPSRPVRPRTRPGRLDLLDAWLVQEAPDALRLPGPVVDVGFGESPVTTRALAAAVRAVVPAARVVGLEPRPGAWGDDATLELLQGGLECLPSLGPAAVVRAMNVLRGYREGEVPAFHAALGATLLEGGLAVEGSTDLDGHLVAAWTWRRRGGALESTGLLLATDFARGFSPWMFRDVLPRDLRRRVRPGVPVHALFSAWAAEIDAGAPGRPPLARLVDSVPRVEGLAATAWELEHGVVRVPALRPGEGGEVPAPRAW